MRLLLRELRDGLRGVAVETLAVAAAILFASIVAALVLAVV